MDPESGSVDGKAKEQMDDTHAAAEEDEGEEGHKYRARSPSITNSLTHNLASEQGGLPALVKGESGLELTDVALHQHVCSSVTLENGSVDNQTKPNGANMTTGSNADPNSVYKRTMIASEPQRTIITKTPKDHFENGPLATPDTTVPLKRIKVEQPWMWITEQAPKQLRDEDEVCEDPLSMLAAVVCLSVTERKGMEEKPFSSRASILRSIKTEPPDLRFVKEEPEEIRNSSFQKSTPLGLQRASHAVKNEPTPSVLLPSVQSLAEKRNLSFDQAIAIEALTQLAAIPQMTQRSIKAESRCENPISNAAPFVSASTTTPPQVVKPTAGVHCNKVSVISSLRHQMSVICPPVAWQGNVIKCSQGFSSKAKLASLDPTKSSSDSDKTPCRRTEQGYLGSPVIKSECSYKDLNDINFRKDCDRVFREEKYRVPGKERNKDEVEVAAQLADLAFIIQSRHGQHSENSPPKGTPVSTIKYNYNSQLTASQKKNNAKKTKAMPSKPRKKKNDGLHEGLSCRMPLSKRMPNGEVAHKGRGKKILTQGRSSINQKKNLFLPLTQIDLKKYRADAQEEKRLLIQQTPFMGQQVHNHSIIRTNHTCQENQSWCLSNGPLNRLNPCNSHASELGRECKTHLLSQVAQPCSGLHHSAELDTSPASAASLSHSAEHHVLANGCLGAQLSPPPSQQSYYKLEKSGPVTILSTATDGDVGHSAESTPSKNSISSFLESPISFLDTPTKNLLNTPSKKVSDLPSCQCMGECVLSTWRQRKAGQLPLFGCSLYFHFTVHCATWLMRERVNSQGVAAQQFSATLL